MAERIVRTFDVRYTVSKPYSGAYEPRRFDTLDEAFAEVARMITPGAAGYLGAQITREEIEVVEPVEPSSAP